MTRDETDDVAARVQRGLEQFYRLERAPSVAPFLRPSSDGEREAVLIRDAEDGAVEIEVCAPQLSSDPDLDSLCQLIEGVSHFVYVADRARRELPATQLELELQAEIDKYVLFVLRRDPFDAAFARHVHGRLYERVHFCHPEGTEAGDRYRLANDLAARLVRRMEVLYAQKGRLAELRDALTRFYGMGQAEKLGFARAA
ncbi:MAG TPA: hypothetical protein VF881_00415 [Polyangiaceae bacterium]